MQPLLIRAKVIQIQEWIRSHVGEGVPVVVTWDRTGGQSFELIGSQREQWTTLAIYGRTGLFRVAAKGSRLPVNDASLRYSVDGDDVRFDASFVVPGLAKRLSPADTTVGAGADNAVGFPAISGLMTIVSVLSFVWQLIHPRVTLKLPGTVGCQLTLNGDVLTMEMIEPQPSVEITVVVTFKPLLDRVIVSTQKLRCEFAGSRIEEREFQIA